MGHELGVMHANAWSCSGPSLEKNCSHGEYGNYYDVMGGGNYSTHFNAFYKDTLGWLDSSAKVSITRNGSYNLSPLESQTGVRAGIITNPGSPSVSPLYVEFRQPIGFDTALAPTSAGLQLNQVVAPAGDFPFPRLINANYAVDPTSQESLMPGNSFNWGSHGIRIDSLSSTQNSSTFNVALTQPICVRGGFMESNIRAHNEVAQNANGYLNFTLTNNDSSSCAPSTVRFSTVISDSNGWQIYTYPNEDIVFTPGETIYPSVSFAPTLDSALGTRTIKVTAYDLTNGRSHSVEQSFEIVPPPSITEIVPQSGTIGTNVTLRGTNFSANKNIVRIFADNMNAYIQNIQSIDGSLTFNFPTTIESYDSNTEKSSQISTPLGFYNIIIINEDNFGPSNVVTFEVTDYTVPLPTASITINGQNDITLQSGTAHQKVWTSTNGTSWGSTVTFAQDPTNTVSTCTHLAEAVPWYSASSTLGAATANGYADNTETVANIGCLVTIVYTVSNSAGSVSDTLRLRVTAPTPTQSITINSPNEETYKPRDTMSIQWSTTGIDSSNNSIGLNVYQKSKGPSRGVVSVTTANQVVRGLVQNKGNYNWTIPQNTPEGNDYVVYLSTGSKSVESNTFTITSPLVPPTCSDPVAYYYYYAPDVKAAGVDALAHWNSYGYKEGRKSCWPAPNITPPGTSNNKPTGVIDSVSSGAIGKCGMAAGWAYDTDKSSASTEINLYVDGAPGAGTGLNAGVTNALRQDVNNAFGITGNHGYNYQIPNLTAGTHTIYVYSHGVDTLGNKITTEPVLLSNSSKTFTCGLVGPALVINTLYKMFLGRDADAGGSTYWQSRLSGGSTITDIAWEFITSAENVARNNNVQTMTSDNYVEFLYTTVLGRASDAEGKKSWVDTLNGESSRKSVLDFFLNSAESKTHNPNLFSFNGQNTSFAIDARSPAVLGASTICTDLTRNMHRGAESSSVTALQTFLYGKGLLTVSPTGFYGDKTVAAVKEYQAEKGLPQTGMVYDFTRRVIEMESCE